MSIHSCGPLCWPVPTKNWSVWPEEGDMTFDLCSTTATSLWPQTEAPTVWLWDCAGDWE